MAMAMDGQALRALDLLQSAAPTSFLLPSPQLSDAAKNASKGLFSSAAHLLQARNSESNKSRGLPELYVDGFDTEQIWIQIESQTVPILSRFQKQILKPLDALQNKPLETFLNIHALQEKNSEKGDTGDGKNLKEEDLVDDNHRKRKKRKKRRDRKEQEENEGEEEEGEEELGDELAGEDDVANERDENDERGGRETKGSEKVSIEDDFLKISELEKFLEEAETEGTNKSYIPELYSSGDILMEEEDEGDDAEDDLGFRDDAGSDEEEFEDGEDLFNQADGIMNLSGDKIKYQDFFKDESSKGNSNKNRDGYQEGNDEEDGDEDDFDTTDKNLFQILKVENKNDKENPDIKEMSTHEKEVENIKSKIERLEKFNLNPKPWVLEGEVTAKSRPKNSALEVELDFEHATKPPPIITPEITLSIEQIIKNRLLEGKFDDVQRKRIVVQVAPTETIEIDENQSQKGLAEIYEAEYMKTIGETPEVKTEMDKLKDEASILFKQLCVKLDALSHFHFVPKPVIEDLNVKVNVPALAMEEAAPVAVSDASLLAPEEIFKSNMTKTLGEMTREENRRKRRKVKRKIKVQLQAKDPLKLRTNVSAAQTKNNIVEKRKVDDYTNSTKIFAKMQELKDNPKRPKLNQKDDKPTKKVSFKL